MNSYFRTVTLGAFTWKNEERGALLFSHLSKMRPGAIALHFLLVTVCLNFPVTFAVARLSPFEFYSRLYGGNAPAGLPDPVSGGEAVENFNLLMMEAGYGKNALLPFLGIAFALTFVIQAAFYLCAVFFLGLSRINAAALSFRQRLALAVFSSTLPVLAAALFGLVLPSVHIIVFYFMVIAVVFQRSKLCPNG